MNIADREYFQRLSKESNAGLVISKPAIGRTVGKWRITLARRISRTDGTFAGIAYGVLSLEHFIKLFSAIELGKYGVISFREEDLSIIVRYPELGKPGSTIGNKSVSLETQEFFKAHPYSGTLEVTTLLDQVQRTISYQKISTYPLYIIVSQAHVDYLDLWQKEAVVALLLTAIFTLAMVFSARMIYRQRVLEIREIAERNQAGEALKESQQNLAITLNSIGDAVIATDTDGRVARMNPAAERLTGWALADALGQPLTEVFRIISAHTRLPALNPVQLVMERGEVVGLANHTALQARDGHEYQIADSAAPIRNAAGATVGVVLVFSDVTEKYQAQEALHFTRFSVEAASESIFWITPDARIVDVNAAACRALGYTREELLQLGVSDVDTHYNAEVWPQHFAELRQCGSLTFESQQRTKEGRLFSVEVAANYVKHGNDERNCAFVRDITERKRAEQGLRLSEQRYRFSLEVTGQIGWSCLPDGQVEDAPMWRQYSGQSLEEAVGWKWLDAIHPEDRESANEAVRIAVAQQCDYSTEYRLRRADGVYRNFMVRGVLLFNDDGSPKEWVGTCIDITDRKQAESKLQLAASVFSHAREGISITNAQGIIIDVNEAFTRITGYSRDEAIGQNARILSSGRQDQSFYAAMWGALTEQGHWTGEIWNRRKDGEVFAEMLTISSVMDDQGKTKQFVALFSDITAIKAHQSQLEHIAHFDALTNLPNRVLLADRLQQAMAQAQRRGQQLAVAYLV